MQTPTSPRPFRLIHTSDWHLGHELHGFDRGAEHDAFLAWLLEQLRAQAADALLVTGDIYDTVNPPVPAQQRLFRFLAGALAASPHLQVILIGGNHDSAARVELPRDLLDARRVALVGSLPREAGVPVPARACIRLHDDTGTPRLVCAAVPYLRPGDLGEGGAAALYRQVAIAADAARGTLPLVVTGHLHVAGGAVSDLSERRIVMGGEETVPAEIFPAQACYVALGHLHRPQRVAGATTIRYAGSPFPLSVTERDYRHSIVVLDIDPDGVRETLVEIPRRVDFLRIPEHGAVPLEQIEAALRGLPSADDATAMPYLEIAVALDGPEPDLRRRIETALDGRAARLTRIERVTQAADGDAAGAAAQPGLGELAPEDVFRRRHKETFGTDATPELVLAFRTLLSETLAPADDGDAAAMP